MLHTYVPRIYRLWSGNSLSIIAIPWKRGVCTINNNQTLPADKWDRDRERKTCKLHDTPHRPGNTRRRRKRKKSVRLCFDRNRRRASERFFLFFFSSPIITVISTYLNKHSDLHCAHAISKRNTIRGRMRRTNVFKSLTCAAAACSELIFISVQLWRWSSLPFLVWPLACVVFA